MTAESPLDDERAIRLVRVDGTDAGEGRVRLDEADDDLCTIVLRYGSGSYVGSGDDFFEALISVRHALENVGLRPHCYGASLHCFPSGMARSMGAARKVYRTVLGSSTKTTDLLPLLGSGEDVQPASVEEQRRFHARWIESLGARST